MTYKPYRIIKGGNMYRVANESEYSIEINRSKFICFLERVFSEAEAKEYILKIKKLHPNATHHCYAFLIGEHDEIQRSNDNGEPSGTAGVPILECLKKNEMNDTIAIVVRYFGGVKLGAGGLIRAYSKSVSEALKHTTIMQTCEINQYEIIFSYDLIGKIDYLFTNKQLTVLEKTYDELVTYRFHSVDDIHKDLSELSNGKVTPTFIKKEIIEIEKPLSQ